MTSLVGFEALMRGKKVTTYGIPFYAGWGLTNDRVNSKRSRVLSLDELVSATLLLYPKYIDPKSLKETTAEKVIEAIEEEKKLHTTSLLYRVKKGFHSFVTRKLQLLLRIITLKNR
jgi:capsular polysaccharide export protein